MDTTLYIIIFKGVLSLFFVFASSIKIFGWQQDIYLIQIEMFKKFGISRQKMFRIGLVEFIGVLLLWVPGYLSFTGAFLLFSMEKTNS